MRGEGEYFLEQWGMWAFHNRALSMTWPSAEPYAAQRGSSVPTPQISDDVGAYLDALVSELRVRFPEEGEALCLFYLAAPSYSRVARIMKIDRRRAASMVSAGAMWIAGRLEPDASR